ncbi:hypothetical protein R1flu_009846 [Riccia fluitans]|uniref:Uncharacterized protein n=1 Tax=Riccia fluitans TaxID=41844 RepID=A0ABD1Z5U6_9MARC
MRPELEKYKARSVNTRNVSKTFSDPIKARPDRTGKLRETPEAPGSRKLRGSRLKEAPGNIGSKPDREKQNCDKAGIEQPEQNIRNR